MLAEEAEEVQEEAVQEIGKVEEAVRQPVPSFFSFQVVELVWGDLGDGGGDIPCHTAHVNFSSNTYAL